MPLYEYLCEKCNIVYEDMVASPSKMKKTVKCEECGKRVKRSFLSAPTLKGGTIPGEGTGRNAGKYHKDMQKAATDMRVGHSQEQQDCDKLKGASPYSNMEMDVGKLVKSGRARRGTAEELKNKKKNIQIAKDGILPRSRRQYKGKDGNK